MEESIEEDTRRFLDEVDVVVVLTGEGRDVRVDSCSTVSCIWPVKFSSFTRYSAGEESFLSLFGDGSIVTVDALSELVRSRETLGGNARLIEVINSVANW